MTDVWCSEASATEPLPGTAPSQTHWLFIEAPGSWGRKALQECSLPAGQRDALAELPEHWRVVLVRRKDRPLRSQRDRLVWLSAPDARPARWRLEPDEPLHPDLLGPGEPCDQEVLFVCCNGSRDRCCARYGRELVQRLRDHAWESSHLGGHRFAPTGVRLSDRVLFGRLTESAGRLALAGGAPAGHVRGPAGWPPPVQVAAAAIWQRHGPAAVSAAQVDGRMVHVTLSDGSTWEVPTSTAPLAPRLKSCCRDPEPGDAVIAGEPVRLGIVT